MAMRGRGIEEPKGGGSIGKDRPPAPECAGCWGLAIVLSWPDCSFSFLPGGGRGEGRRQTLQIGACISAISLPSPLPASIQRQSDRPSSAPSGASAGKPQRFPPREGSDHNKHKRPPIRTDIYTNTYGWHTHLCRRVGSMQPGRLHTAHPSTFGSGCARGHSPFTGGVPFRVALLQQ